MSAHKLKEGDQIRGFSFEQHRSTSIDKIAAKVRYHMIDKLIGSMDIELNNKSICDVGCGYNANFLLHIKKKFNMTELYGVDIDLNPDMKNLVIFSKSDLENADFDISDNSIDVVTSLAVIEHLYSPAKYLKEIRRVLVPGGYLLITTPTVLSKPILYFFAYTGISTKEEVLDHKLYYSKKLLHKVLLDGFDILTIKIFSMGLNMYSICRKKW
jgi:ubiquinone/menaquinone biosynthesis C-methylase UbiE